MQGKMLVLPLLAVAVVTSTSLGQLLDAPATEISFQAKLMDDKGQPVPDGPHVLDFFFYISQAAILPSDSILNVDVVSSNGVVAVRLGPIDTSFFNGRARWIGMTVDDDDDNPTGDVLSPRIQFGAVPYAYRADRVENTELTDDVELGNNVTAGSMVVHAGIGAEAMAVDGSNRTVRLFDQAGAERVVLRGDDGSALVGQIRIESDPGVTPLWVQRTGEPNTDVLINSQGRVAIGDPVGTLAKLTINSDGEEAFRVRINDITHFAVAPDGQVGVGTSLPVARLQVNGASTDDIVEVRRFGTTTPSLRIKNSGEVIVGDEDGVSAQLTVNATSDDAFRVRTDGSTRFIVAQDGQVGIGTSVPSARLQINGASGEDVLEVRPFGTTTPSLRVTNGGDVVVGDEAGVSAKLTINAEGEDAFRVRTDGGTRFMVAQDGQVGVGTSVPSARLQINGASGENPLEVRSFGTTTPALRVRNTGEVIVGNETGASAQLTVNAEIGEDPLRLRVDGFTRALLRSDGNMGIGIASPAARLHVSGSDNNGSAATFRVTSGTQNMLFDGNEIDTINTSMFLNNNSSENVILVQNGGGVGIGTTNIPADSLLAVDGKVMCEEVEVQLSQNWPDYVFADDYRLMSLEQLEKHIATEKRLPGIPAAAEVQSSGINLGNMQTMTIEKVEELTLYVLQLNRRLDGLERENDMLRSRLNASNHDQNRQ